MIGDSDMQRYKEWASSLQDPAFPQWGEDLEFDTQTTLLDAKTFLRKIGPRLGGQLEYLCSELNERLDDLVRRHEDVKYVSLVARNKENGSDVN